MNLLFFGVYADVPYIPAIKSLFIGHSVRVLTTPITTFAELELYCRKYNITSVLSTSTYLLSRLIPQREGTRKSPSLDNYAGSFFEKSGISIVFVPPLEHIHTVPYGRFLLQRYISKFTQPEKWFPEIPFKWEVLNASNHDSIFTKYSSADIIAVDIETIRTPLAITVVGYTAIFCNADGSIESHSTVLPLDSEFNLSILRRFNWELKAPKVTQNGKYDISYLARYNAPLYNWCFDTVTAMHSWYAELPKDLAFIGAFCVRKAMYWKDLAGTGNLDDYYYYNCRDTYTTAVAFLAWLAEAPDWAKKNYVMEFPMDYPAHLCEMTGIARDMERLKAERQVAASKIATVQASLDTIMGGPVNVNSSPQMKTICKILGLGKTVGGIYIPVDSCDEAALKKFSWQHPLNAVIFGKVLEIREHRKSISTYLRTDEDADKKGEGGAKEFHGRILYSINPHGTETGRNSSREHHFWCGMQIQNITRGSSVKATLRADPGFLLGECDLERAESYGTAFTSGDDTLLRAVCSENDFHSTNCSAFFGVSYADIYDNLNRKTKNKKLRDLAKRINHGANYCMGPATLLDTMGYEEVIQAQRLLALPKAWTPLKVCEYLLERFHGTYPGLEGRFYPAIWNEVLTTNKLVGATGWTRYCFGKPIQGNKHVRNSYVAHVPQSLNAMLLNKAFLKVFTSIAMAEKHKSNFKLLAQIHDSILFQYREGHAYLCDMVKDCMEFKVPVRGYDGKTRELFVPAAIKKGGKYWSDLD